MTYQPRPGPSAAAFVDPDLLVGLAVQFRESLGIVESRITGHSMRPTLPAGSRVRIGCGLPGAVPTGSVVAFVGAASLMAHRLVGRGRGPRARGFLLTRGDATIICDAPVHSDRVLGIITHVAAGGQWQPVPPPPKRPAMRVAGAVLRGFMALTLEIDPRMARTIALACFRVRSLVQRVRRRAARMPGVPH